MATKTIFVIATLIAAAGAIGIIAGAPAADAQQQRAPGQTGCNPGKSDGTNFCVAPGQQDFGNPGQCQKSAQELLDFKKEAAHNLCHESI